MGLLSQLELFENGFDDNQELEVFLRKLPKIELHSHLSGCLRLDTVKELVDTYNIELPKGVKKDLYRSIVIKVPVKNYPQFFLPWRRALNKIMEIALINPDIFSRMILEMAEDFAKDGVIYAEVRFSTREASVKDEDRYFLKLLRDAFIDANKRFGIVIRGILGFTRNSFYQLNKADRLQIVKQLVTCAHPFLGNTIVGFDLWGNEQRHPPKAFAEEFKIIDDARFPITIHAGEVYSSTFIRDSVTILKAKRLGHATAIMKDARIFELLRQRNVLVEVCITSNIKSSVVKNLAEHPVKKMIEECLPISFCTDDTMVLNTTLSKELSRALRYKLINPDYLQDMYVRALGYSFLPKTDVYCVIKEELMTYDGNLIKGIKSLTQ